MQMVQRHLSVTAVQGYLVRQEHQEAKEIREIQEPADQATELATVLVHLELALAMMLSKLNLSIFLLVDNLR